VTSRKDPDGHGRYFEHCQTACSASRTAVWVGRISHVSKEEGPLRNV